MIKRLIAFFLLLAFAMQLPGKAFVVVDYYLNTSSYAKNCENKSRPKMHCNGKCQMMKKMQQEEKKEQQNQERKGENKNEITLSSKSFFSTSVSSPLKLIALYTLLPEKKEVKMPRSIFHPPGA